MTSPTPIPAPLQQAIDAHKAGKLHEAEIRYRAILQAQPRHPEANHNLGMLAIQVGKPEAALPHLKAALEANPHCGQFWVSYGQTLTQVGGLEAARALLDQARTFGVASDIVRTLEASIRHGVVPGGVERPTTATTPDVPREVTEDKRKRTREIVALFNQQNYQAAERQSAVFMQKYPKDAFGYKALGSLLIQRKENEAAVDILKLGLKFPNIDHEYYNTLASGLQQLGRFDEAIDAYMRALELKPDFADAHYNIGRVLIILGKTEESIPYFRKALKNKSNFFEAYNNLGIALNDIGHVDEAIACYRKALKIKPDYIDSYNNMGAALKDMGKLDEAAACYRNALKHNPYFADAYYNMLNLRNYKPNGADFDRMITIVESHKYSSCEKMNAHFALGKYYDKTKNYQDAFVHFTLGHALRREYNKGLGSGYDHTRKLHQLNKYKEFFTPDFFHERRSWGIATDTPIFIVGFPRSGTSLVEQILASHSLVFGAGELKNIAHIASNFGSFEQIKSKEQFASLFSMEGCIALADDYIKYIEKLSGKSRYVVDKMPHNFEHVWLINILFPKATILHCTRSPEDTCLSCYCNKFTESHEYIDDISDLGMHYTYYQDMMNLWKSVSNIKIYDIRYESLVESPDYEIRRALDLCKLKFEEQCLEFYKTKRAVRTASASQIREKMYTSSIGKWKRYEPFVGQLMDVLQRRG